MNTDASNVEDINIRQIIERSSMSCIASAELQCGESWKISHSNSIGSPSIVSKVLYCDKSLNQSNCRSQAVFDVGF